MGTIEEAAVYAKENSINEEDALTDLVENLCSVKKKEGRWVSKLDIVREDSDAQLSLQRQDTPGWYKAECLVVQRACEASLKGKDETLVEMLQSGKNLRDMKKGICKKLCKKAVPKLAQWKDEAFSARDA